MKVYIQRFWKLFAQIIPIWFRGFVQKKIMIFVMNEGYFPLDNGNKFEFYVFEFDDLLRKVFLWSLLTGFDFCFEKKFSIKFALYVATYLTKEFFVLIEKYWFSQVFWRRFPCFNDVSTFCVIPRWFFSIGSSPYLHKILILPFPNSPPPYPTDI